MRLHQSGYKNNCVAQVSDVPVALLYQGFILKPARGDYPRGKYPTVAVAQKLVFEIQGTDSLFLFVECFVFKLLPAPQPHFLSDILFQNQTMLIHRDGLRTFRRSFSVSFWGFIRASH